MISVYSLGSGSKGNCVILSDGKTSVMIDAGLSSRATVSKLSEIGLRFEDLSGLLLTHEHADHIRSLALVSDKLPVFSHEDTLKEAICLTDGVNISSLKHVDSPFTLGGFYITPFSVSHDAAHPYGFTVDNGNNKVAYVTDSGYISKGIMKQIEGCDTVVIESNHDKELLLHGSYPERLKRRIFSDKGHLCNDETALTVCDLAKKGANRIMLAHISENNNLGELAYWTTARALKKMGANEDVEVKIALQRETVVLK